MNEAKLLLVDDHPMWCQGLRALLSRQPNLSLVGEAGTAAEGLRLAQELAPDLVLMDIHLPDRNGIEATRQMLHDFPAVKVIVLSAEDNRDLVDRALEAGACGYLCKTSAVEELLQAIDLVMDGKLYLSARISAGILEDYRKSLAEGHDPFQPSLCDREKKLLRLVAEGHRNKEIANQLGISMKSVEGRRARLMKKLHRTSSADLVRYAIKAGIAPP